MYFFVTIYPWEEITVWWGTFESAPTGVVAAGSGVEIRTFKETRGVCLKKKKTQNNYLITNLFRSILDKDRKKEKIQTFGKSSFNNFTFRPYSCINVAIF